MADYTVFGGCLRSELLLPELAPVAAVERPDWELRRVAALGARDDVGGAGEDVVYGDVRVRCYEQRSGFRLVFDDTGDFEISGDGSRIDWLPRLESSEEAARADVIGRVLALALHAAGVLSLHASAVTIGGRGLVFIAPKYHGKSTLAMALVAAGARLVTDDTLPVEAGPPVTMRPGVHRVRLWPDAVARLQVSATQENGSKPLVGQLSPDRMQLEPAPIAAIYALSPIMAADAGTPPVERVRQSPIESALTLVAHGKLAPLLRGRAAAAAFQAAASIAAATDVYDLRIVRDLARMDEVVARIMEWHA